MKKLFILLAFCCLCSIMYSQPRFNRVYRMFATDSMGLQTATTFHSMRVLDDRIYIAGIGTRGVDSIYTNSGIFSSFDMSGNLIKNTYYGAIPNNSDFNNDVLLTEPNNQFSLAGFNFDYTFSFWKIDKQGKALFKKKYIPLDTTSKFGAPNGVVKIGDKYAVSLYAGYGNISKSIVYIIDTTGQTKKVVEIYDNERISNSKFMIKNKNNNLTVCLFNTSYSSTDTNYVYISQLREIDTLGNTKWVYNTPRNRYIYFKKFIQLANGNYLAWGDEELSKIVGRYRTVYGGNPYIAEINPQTGLVWESKIGLIGRMYGFKMLKDSSMVLSCTFDIGFSNAMSCIIKLNKNRDSLYRRNFRPSSINSSRVIPFSNQIEELENGDLLISGYVEDRMTNSPTVGQWGWLVRTDSLGCSLEPSSCRTPTHDIEKSPLSINIYPNPATDQLRINWQIGQNTEGCHVQLFNMQGQKVMHTFIERGKDDAALDVSMLAEGLYFLSLDMAGKGVFTRKVVIAR